MLTSLFEKCAQRLFAQLYRAGVKAPTSKPVNVRLTVESLEDRVVPSLTPVNTTAYPYSTIVRLEITFPKETDVGTGVMVDRFHVLTAGHCVYDAAAGGWAKSIKVVPDQQGNNAPFGTAYSTYVRTFNTWVNYSNSHPHSTAPGDMDMGLITLNRTIGDFTSWMSYGYNNNNSFFSSGSIMNTAGYPATSGYTGKQMYFSSGAIAGLSSDGTAIQYYQSNITTYGGQSGSPVWTLINGTRTVYGIHVGGSGLSTSLNFATRITQTIFNTLQSWRSQDAVPSTQSATIKTQTASVSGGTFGTAVKLQSEGEGGDAPVVNDAAGNASVYAVVVVQSLTTSPMNVPLNAQPEAASRLEVNFRPSNFETLAAKDADGKDNDLALSTLAATHASGVESLEAIWMRSALSSLVAPMAA